MLGLVIFFLLFRFLIKQAVGSALEERESGARDGFGDFWSEVWHGFWERQAAALAAARAAKPLAPGKKVRLRDRLRVAKEALAAGARKVADHPITRRIVEPVGEQAKPEPVDPQPTDPAAGTVPTSSPEGTPPPVGTRRLTDDGWEEWTGTEWKPATDSPTPKPDDNLFTAAVDEHGQRVPEADIDRTAGVTYCWGCRGCGQVEGGYRYRSDAKTASERHVCTPANSPAPTKEESMSQPTGEAVNYETTVSELQALEGVQTRHLDFCTAAVNAIEQTRAAIDGMQTTYRAAAAAAASMHEHLKAKNLDGGTLGHTGQTVDAMPPTAVDAMYDQLDAMDTMAKQRQQEAEIALASTQAALKHVVATYGEAHAQVAQNLSGDPSFLESAGSGQVTTGAEVLASAGVSQ